MGAWCVALRTVILDFGNSVRAYGHSGGGIGDVLVALKQKQGVRSVLFGRPVTKPIPDSRMAAFCAGVSTSRNGGFCGWVMTERVWG